MLHHFSRLPRPARFLLNVYIFLGLLHFLHGIFEADLVDLFVDEARKVHMSRSMANGADIWWAGFMANMSALAVEPYTPKILADVQWWNRLNLVQIQSMMPKAMPESVRKPYRTFDPYFRRPLPAEGDKPWHHWLFLNNEPEDDSVASTWHDAFSKLVQYHYRHPASNHAEFHAVQCGLDSSLCAQWGTQWPALVHLTTDQGNHSRHQVEQDGVVYEKVAARVIPLPLTANLMHLPPGSFPSPLNQLKSLTHSPEEWKGYKSLPDMHEISRIKTRLRQQAISRNRFTYGILDWMVETVTHTLAPAWLPGSYLIRVPLERAAYAGYMSMFLKKAIHKDRGDDRQKLARDVPEKLPSLDAHDGSAFRWLGVRAADWFGCMGEDNVKYIRTIHGIEPMIRHLSQLMVLGRNGTDPGGGISVYTEKHQDPVWHRCFKLDD